MNEPFDQWINEKLVRKEIGRSTYDRYTIDFYRCFEEINCKKVKSIDETYLEGFSRGCIAKYNMITKQFSNFRTLICGLLKYAKGKKVY